MNYWLDVYGYVYGYECLPVAQQKVVNGQILTYLTSEMNYFKELKQDELIRTPISMKQYMLAVHSNPTRFIQSSP